MSDRIPSTKRVKRSYPVGNRIQQLQQIETWQALLEKLAGKE